MTPTPGTKKKKKKRSKKASDFSEYERVIIIDGYNLILRSPAFAPDDKRDLAGSREKLVNLLSWAVGSGEVEFHLIFDGAELDGHAPRVERSGPVTVRFSDPPQKADDVIRQLVEEHADREQKVTVVTADVEVASHARACGATVVLSDLFAASLFPERIKDQVKQYRGKRKPASPEEDGSDKPLGFSKKELEEWARLFSEQRDEEPH